MADVPDRLYIDRIIKLTGIPSELVRSNGRLQHINAGCCHLIYIF